ncbi:MAG TPA: TlyA family RNA methyltransferase [Spirochaetota bacterium]|nr:TlyA family RNA methyltransferase [Spirochaetota bacterium]HNT10610.1 TlyA family RNA methyltransferase [Spirochaetota bacterium]
MQRVTRLDVHLSTHGLSKSRESAKKEIMAGWVSVDGATIRTPSTMIAGTEAISISRPKGVYASRGGDKLHHALTAAQFSVAGVEAVDLGASTGGFTDCLLAHGATRVFAIDVGYGQFEYRLRIDQRVVLMERTNVRTLTRDMFNDANIRVLVADLSFISLTKIFPVIHDVFSPIEGFLLVKPQFEATKGEHKKGVVRGRDRHQAILKRFLDSAVANGITPRSIIPSPIKGPAGNIEFFVHFVIGNTFEPTETTEIETMVECAIAEAYERFEAE